MANSAASSSGISIASTTSSPGPSISQRGSFRRTPSSSTLGGSPNAGPSRSRAYSNASSLTIGSNTGTPARSRAFKARRLPLRPAPNGTSTNVLASTITEHDVLQHVTRPEQVDLLALSEDSISSLFVRFGVKEVRHIQELARQQASSKQQELRTMVGERYRDLLGAADSIVRMRTSSKHLMDQLSHARRDCSREQMQRRTRTTRRHLQRHSKMPSQLQPGTNPAHHSLAMLIKLLLDAPEHIWRALEAQDYLSAARLAMLGRVVYRELASMTLTGEDQDENADENDTPDVFRAVPLVERQWETLSQLATQIVRRAKTGLQRWDVSFQTTAETLAAILLVDNTPLDSLLEMLMTQRQTALSELLSEHARADAQDKATPSVQIIEALKVITTTVHQASQLMQHDSLLLKTVEQLQVPNIANVETDSASLEPIINRLPNAHLLLRYLPDTVTSFTPFIDTSAPPEPAAIDSAISAWFETARSRFQQALSKATVAVQDAASLAAFKRQIDTFLTTQNDVAHAASLLSLVEEVSLKHLETIYETSLDRLVRTIHTEWSSVLAQSSSSVLETNASANAFYDLPVPNVGAFDALNQALDKRLSGRSPLLDQCLSCVESLCEHFKADLSPWFESNLLHSEAARQTLIAGYKDSLQKSFETLSSHFKSFMEQDHPALFMARLWLALANDPNGFFQLVSLDDSFAATLSPLSAELQTRQEQAIQQWLANTIHSALSITKAAFDSSQNSALAFEADDSDSRETASGVIARQPTPALFQACLLLAQHTEQLDQRILKAKADLPQTIVEEFQKEWLDTVRPLSSAMSTSQASALLWDYAFLDTLSAMDAGEDWRDEVCEQIATTWPAFQEGVKSGLQQFNRRTQNLFSSLRQDHDQQEGTKATKVDKTSVLLPLGVPPTSGAGAPASSGPTKLGARFGLLPVS